MREKTNKSPVIFWSWQTDSPAKYNRNFIEDCLKRAVKQIAKESDIVMIVDRDTKGVGGTPPVVEIILEKIRTCDIFVYDSSLVYKDPRPAPNPNVLLELGYALAIIGERRLIGVFNTANGSSAEDLPFDFKHRRWPITYCYSGGSADCNKTSKEVIKSQLISDFKKALELTIKEPKEGALRADVNFHAAQRLWDIINSTWIQNWYARRSQNPQFEEERNFDQLEIYLEVAARPENIFINSHICDTHDNLLQAIHKHLSNTAREMVSEGESYIISIKRAGMMDDKKYDSIYDHQVNVIISGLDGILLAWNDYVSELRTYYPEVIS